MIEPVSVELIEGYVIDSCPGCLHPVSVHTDGGCCGTKGSVKGSDCSCPHTAADFQGGGDIDPQLLMKAAEKIVLARVGEQYEILGCEPPGLDNNCWQFFVERKGIPPRSRRTTTITITEADLETVAREQQSVEQIQGTKPKQSEIQEKVRSEYGNDGVEDLFESRD